MIKRNKLGTLTLEEKTIAKSLLNRGMRNQDIQALININRDVTINSARITEVKKDSKIRAASETTTDFFLIKKKSFDPKTGLNFYDHERLIKSREAMILAVNAFNSPTLLFKTELFSVLACIAWTYLFHEHYERKKVKIFDEGGRSLLLSQIIKRSDFPLSKGIANNLDAIINIRNDVEHKLLGKGDIKFTSIFQACCLNYNESIKKIFGEKVGLETELSIALQFSKLNFEQIETIQKYAIPPNISALDAKLHEKFSEEEKLSLEYQFKVFYTLTSACKSEASIQFIHPNSSEGKEVHSILVKHKLADEEYPYKPKPAWETVAKNIGKPFNSRHHLQAAYYYNVRPRNKSSTAPITNKDYCIYHKAHRDYTYSQKWVDFLSLEMLDDAKYNAIKAVKI